MPTIEPGRVLGDRYTLTSRIASGGMGDVWEATDGILHREVAVKILRMAGGPADEGFTERFRDEATHTAALTHPNIAAVYDYGEDPDGTAYLVMERVPGEPLSDLIRDSGGLDPDQVRWVIGQAALALAAAHDAGVVHRDVKPGNIIVTPDGTAKLTDFGIARAGEGNGHTMTGEVLGTPDYISPEQALGEPATTASDVYSLGVVAHEMLTGTKPFDMGTPVATALAHVNDTPPILPHTVPDDLRRVIEACLSKDPAERPADAREVATALGMVVESAATAAVGATTRMEVITADTPHWRTRAQVATAQRRGHRRSARRIWVLAPIAVLVVAAAFGMGKLFGSEESQAHRTPTTTSQTSSPATTGTPTSTTTSPTTTATTATKVAPAPAPAPAPEKGKGKPADPGKGKGSK
jgi:serine/threonine-protein kinase